MFYCKKAVEHQEQSEHAIFPEILIDAFFSARRREKPKCILPQNSEDGYLHKVQKRYTLSPETTPLCLTFNLAWDWLTLYEKLTPSPHTVFRILVAVPETVQLA